MTKFRMTGIAVAMFGIATSAQASSLDRPCTATPQKQWLSLEAMQSKVEAVGFKVRKAKLKNSCAEFYVTAKTGDRMELFVDPATGTIIDGR